MSGCRILALAWLLIGVAIAASGKAEAPADIVAEVTTAQRLALRQLDQLVADGSPSDVIELLTRTVDEADGRVIAAPAEVNGAFPRYVPIPLFLADRLLRYGAVRPELLVEYRQQFDAVAAARIAEVRRRGDFVDVRRVADRFLATSHGDEALLLLADEALARGHYWTAISVLRRIDPRWQAAEVSALAAESRGIGWEFVLPRAEDAKLAELAQTLGIPGQVPGGGWALGTYVGSDLNQAEVGLRLVAAYRVVGEQETATALARMVEVWFADQQVYWQGRKLPLGTALERALNEPSSVTLRGDEWPTVGRDGTRVWSTAAMADVSPVPLWRVKVPTQNAPQREYPDEPPIGAPSPRWALLNDAAAGPRVSPIIHQGKVMAHAGAGLWAWDLKSGARWPDPAEDIALSEEGVAAPTPRVGVMPADARPHYTLSADDGRVVMRVGPPESGWLPVARPALAQSRLAVIDLVTEGQLLEGYPARLPFELRQQNFELEGTPLLVGPRLYVGLNLRDGATERSSVACFDVASGVMLFQTETLSAGRPLVEQSSQRMARALLSYREGTLYYHADVGVIAAIDAEGGDLRWLVRYPRGELMEGGFPRRRRAQRRRMTPPAIVGPQMIVFPSDLDRLVSFDPYDGRLIWATEPGRCDDVDQVLGQVDEWLIVGGDVLSWLDRHSGRVEAVWPAMTTSQPIGALATPRRAGRGLLAGEEVFWPTDEAIWIFAARPAQVDGGWLPVPRRRVDLEGMGVQGGDLIAADGVLLITRGTDITALAAPLVEN